jgi:hypothetical protein
MDDVEMEGFPEQRQDLSTLRKLRLKAGEFKLEFINGLEKTIEREINKTTRYSFLLKYLPYPYYFYHYIIYSE